MLAAWFLGRSLVERILVVATVLMLAALVVVYAVTSWRHSHTAKVEAKVEAGHIDAVTKSGADAVATQGNRQANEATADETARGAKNAIDHASNTSSIVNAGRDGLRQLRNPK